MKENYLQSSLWDFMYEEKHIDKPIRLIELFSGIGAQFKALKRLTDNVESYKTCEWAIPSIAAYNAIHIKDFTDYSASKSKEELISYLDGNISSNYDNPCNVRKLKESKLREIYNNCIATHNLMNIMKVKGKDLQIVDTDKYEYIMTYSFPCQDLSLAGKGKGMSVSQADGGTRSGLLWEVERILTELSRERERALPQILLMENVPEVISSKNIRDFQKWESFLTNLGYKNYVEILNAKDYGIPQNRRRCFMISLLGEYTYHFPSKIKLTKKLKDMLESNVDEKYYLSSIDISRISNWKAQQKPLENIISSQDTNKVCPTLTARGAGEEHSGMILVSNDDNLTPCDYKSPIKIANYGNGHHAKDIYDENGLSPTITTGNHGLGQAIAIKNATKQGYLLATDGDGIDISTRMQYHRGNVQKNTCQTLTTMGGENVGVLSNLRIRKLTPCECMRLMGFEDADYQAMVDAGLSNSAIYHCAGDSIVVNVLENIFKNLM